MACRRIRSALAAYRPLVDTEVTEPVRAELRWLGHALGDSRDAVVARELLLAALESEDPALVHGPVRERVVSTYDVRAREGMTGAVQVLDGERYAALLVAYVSVLVYLARRKAKGTHPAEAGRPVSGAIQSIPAE